MTSEQVTPTGTVRNLRAADLDRVVAIDKAWVGHSRRGFFEKRLAAVQDSPDKYLTLGVEADGELAGYAIARFGSGEFGTNALTAAIDAVGIDRELQGKGLGRSLMAGLEEALESADVGLVFSQSDWSNRGLMGFFAAAGFSLAPRVLIERPINNGDGRDTADTQPVEELFEEDSGELDFSDPSGDDFQSLAHDRVPIRSMTVSDLADIVRIDRRITHRDREAYFRSLMEQALSGSSVRVSLVAVLDDRVVGFIMARVDHGEFGRTEPVAVLDTLGIDPDHQNHEIGGALMSQLMMNLSGLMVDRVRTIVPWDGFDLLGFMAHHGFQPSQRLALWRHLN